MPTLSEEEFIKLPEEKQLELSGLGEQKPGKVLSKEEFHALPEEHQEALAAGKPMPNAEADENDRLVNHFAADPMSLSAMERQQAMALSQGAPPQYSKGQMEIGRKAEVAALAGMFGLASLIPITAAAPVAASTVGSTGGILAEAAPAAAPAAKSLFGGKAAHLAMHVLKEKLPFLEAGTVAGALGYAGSAIERRLHHFLK